MFLITLFDKLLAFLEGLFSNSPNIQAHAPPISLKNAVRRAIYEGITVPLKLPPHSVDILLVQSELETAAWTARSFKATNSLFNRHKGSGRGDWTGQTYFAHSGDEDLRVYRDVYQSARDMAQLLQDKLYANALAALRQADAVGYYEALHRAGFAATPTYAGDLTRRYHEAYA